MKIIALAAAAVVAASSANALSITQVDDATFAAYLAGADVTTEDFESYSVGEVPQGQSFATSVGDFSTLGGVGTGGTVTGTPGNTGTNLYLRIGNLPAPTVFGRYNTTPGGEKFLDSNDTLGFLWNVSLGNTSFESIAFALTDGADVGATVTISTPGAQSVSFAPSSSNASARRNYVVNFGGAVTSATVSIAASRLNDGMGVDDVSVQMTPVPLPATALLVVTGIGALGALRRRCAA
jgi:hypothetical protein